MTTTIAPKRRGIDIPKWAEAPILFMAAVVFVYLIASLPEDFVDWRVFYGASLTDPYAQYGFLNPFWLKWLVSPFNLLPFEYGFALFVLCIIVFLLYIFKDNWLFFFLAVATPQFMALVVNGQVDGIVLIGYWLLKQNNLLGVAFMLTKPQVMLGSVIQWWIATEKRNKIASAVLVVGLTIAGFALYGNWIVAMLQNIDGELYHPVSIAPNVPLLGIAIFAIGIWKKNMFLSGLGTLFVTPYVAMHSLWVYWTAGLLENPKKGLAMALFLVNWAVAIIFT
jgi:hypothetical protein